MYCYLPFFLGSFENHKEVEEENVSQSPSKEHKSASVCIMHLNLMAPRTIWGCEYE